jgi:hypothetical protein
MAVAAEGTVAVGGQFGGQFVAVGVVVWSLASSFWMCRHLCCRLSVV